MKIIFLKPTVGPHAQGPGVSSQELGGAPRPQAGERFGDDRRDRDREFVEWEFKMNEVHHSKESLAKLADFGTA